MTAYTEDKREKGICELEIELEKTKKEISELKIEYSDKMKPNLDIFKIEKKNEIYSDIFYKFKQR